MPVSVSKHGGRNLRSDRRRRVARYLGLGLAALWLAALAVPMAAAQQLLRSFELGTLPGSSFSQAQAVSPNGTIAGRALGADGNWHVFLWTQSRGLIDLGVPGYSSVVVNGVNDSGRVVGSTYGADGQSRVFIASEGGTLLDSQVCVGYCDQLGINASGLVVGSHLDASGRDRAFVWSPGGGFTDLPAPPYAIGSRAFAVNDAGQVSGSLVLGVGPNILNAVRWSPAGGGYAFLDLGRFADQAYGTGINAGGEVIGVYGDSSGNYQRGFRWTEAGGLEDLSASAANVLMLFPRGITARGLIAGELINSNWSTQAFMYKAGVGLGRLPTPPGLHNAGAVSVDSAGLATGWGMTGDYAVRHAVAWQSCQVRDVHPGNPLYPLSAIQAANDQSLAVGWVASGDYSQFRATAWEFARPGPPSPTPCAFDESGDSEAPLLTVPGNLTVEATGPGGAVVSYAASAADAVDGPVGVTCAPASGALFPLGTTGVSCAATDAAGNQATAAFTVTVLDTRPPAIWVVPEVTGVATSPAGAVVTFAPSVSDAVDPAPTVTVSPASGSTFPIGATSVTVTARDAANNSSTATFTVTVTPPSPTAGRMSGEGRLELGARRLDYEFVVRERATGADRGHLHLRSRAVTPGRTDHDADDDERGHGRSGNRGDRFESSGVTEAVFYDQPGVRPGGRATMDTVVFAGTGRWNGAPGHRFTVTAVDAGERGAGRDTFAVTITAPDGRVVLEGSGPIRHGNNQSTRVKR